MKCLFASFTAAALATLGFVACSSDSGSASGDAGTLDGGVDTGVSTTRPDSATGDSAPEDTGAAQDTGAGDAAPSPCTPDFAGCTEVDAGGEAGVGNVFLDVGAADRTIDFGGTVGLAYAPKCLKIKAGQKVTWNGDFASHPLTPATCNPSGGDAIPATNSGTTATVTFNTKGTYGYYCMFHGVGGGSASAMDGVIVVY